MIKYACKKCRQPMESPDSQAGNVENCPRCRARMIVPRVAEAPTEVVAAAAPTEELASAMVQAAVKAARQVPSPLKRKRAQEAAEAQAQQDWSDMFLVICSNPNCGYRGPGVRRPVGDMVCLIFLFLLALLPGLLYAIFCYRGEILCPACGVKCRDIPHWLARLPSPRERRRHLRAATVVLIGTAALALLAVLAAALSGRFNLG
jgi:DNA-directed RNA polymerase subunit RPC12/RpoP